jgi:hypothetical protein
MIRLEPGAELSAGETWVEHAGHGLTPNGFLMHESCTGGAPQACYAEVDLFPGAYSFTARAFSKLDCPADQTCDCTPGPSGSCTTSVQRGAGQVLSASAGLTLAEPSASLPVPSVVLRFAGAL